MRILPGEELEELVLYFPNTSPDWRRQAIPLEVTTELGPGGVAERGFLCLQLIILLQMPEAGVFFTQPI